MCYCVLSCIHMHGKTKCVTVSASVLSCVHMHGKTKCVAMSASVLSCVHMHCICMAMVTQKVLL